MSRLAIHPSNVNTTPILTTTDGARIAQKLEKVGVRFERWAATAQLPPGAGQDEVLTAYAKDVERLKQLGGYKTQDVVRMHPDHPDRKVARAKFLNEHIHEDDEVRFFVEGSGTFFLHIDDKVYEILCEKDDLLSVPAGTKHWFDMGDRPLFAAIRIFISPDGWVAKFTGDTIATRFIHEAA